MTRQLALILTLGAACAPPDTAQVDLDGSQVGDDGDEAVCVEVWSEWTDPDTVPDGMSFSASDLLALSVGEFTGELDRDNGSTEPVTLTVTSRDQAWLIEHEPAFEGADCRSLPRLEVRVDYALSVDDLLHVQDTECAWATQPDRMMLSQRVDEETLTGDLTPSWDADAWPQVQLSVSWHRDGPEFTGALAWEGTSAADPSGQGESVGSLTFDSP